MRAVRETGGGPGSQRGVTGMAGYDLGEPTAAELAAVAKIVEQLIRLAPETRQAVLIKAGRFFGYVAD